MSPKNTSNDTPQPRNSGSSRQKAYRLLNEGGRLLKERRYDEALAVLQEADELLPDDPDILISLGGALVMAGKWNKAERFLEEAVQRHPDNARLWLNLAAAILGRLQISPRHRQDKAIEAYQRAILLDPVAPSAHYNIGLIHAERKNWRQAMHWFEAAVRANPLDKDARLWLERARRAYDEARQSSDDIADEETRS